LHDEDDLEKEDDLEMRRSEASGEADEVEEVLLEVNTSTGMLSDGECTHESVIIVPLSNRDSDKGKKVGKKRRSGSKYRGA